MHLSPEFYQAVTAIFVFLPLSQRPSFITSALNSPFRNNRSISHTSRGCLATSVFPAAKT